MSVREPPETPPLCVPMGVRKEKFDADREEVYPRWKAALEAANGCVTYAARAFWPVEDVPGMSDEDRKKQAKTVVDRGNRYTRRFGLVEYAASLRARATGHARGRQDR